MSGNSRMVLPGGVFDRRRLFFGNRADYAEIPRGFPPKIRELTGKDRGDKN